MNDKIVRRDFFGDRSEKVLELLKSGVEYTDIVDHLESDGFLFLNHGMPVRQGTKRPWVSQFAIANGLRRSNRGKKRNQARKIYHADANRIDLGEYRDRMLVLLDNHLLTYTQIISTLEAEGFQGWPAGAALSYKRTMLSHFAIDNGKRRLAVRSSRKSVGVRPRMETPRVVVHGSGLIGLGERLVEVKALMDSNMTPAMKDKIIGGLFGGG